MRNCPPASLRLGLVFALSTSAVALSSGGCNIVEGLTDSCDQFPGSVSTLSLSGDAQAFVQAGADVVAIAGTMEHAVLTSCLNIDGDLSVTDTWTAMGPSNGGTLDDEVTEACKQAADAITTTLQASGSAQADCVLSVTGGQCQVDAMAEAQCVGQCSGMASCSPGQITETCSPGDLSGSCSGSCQVNATCEGSAQVQAACSGSCEADCTGSCTPGTLPSVHCEGTCTGNCTGTCTASGGTATTVNAASCDGSCSGRCDAECDYDPGTPAHCDGTCQGTCDGNCMITAMGGVMCSGSATCRGGCSVMVTAPKCEGDITAPSCNASANCQASCQSDASFTAMCTPPSADLECSGSASAAVQKVVTTVQANFGALLQVANLQRPLLQDEVTALVSAGSAVVSDLGSESGQALACARVAVTGVANASASINVSIMASASVSASASTTANGT